MQRIYVIITVIFIVCFSYQFSNAGPIEVRLLGSEYSGYAWVGAHVYDHPTPPSWSSWSYSTTNSVFYEEFDYEGSHGFISGGPFYIELDAGDCVFNNEYASGNGSWTFTPLQEVAVTEMEFIGDAGSGTVEISLEDRTTGLSIFSHSSTHLWGPMSDYWLPTIDSDLQTGHIYVLSMHVNTGSPQEGGPANVMWRNVLAVPEPSTLLLLGSGLIGLVGYGRKKLLKK